MSSLEAWMSNFFDHSFTTLTKIATTEVLFTKILSSATGNIRCNKVLTSPFGLPSRGFVICWSAPVCDRPETMTNMIPTMITDELTKPEKASEVSSTPVTNNMPMAPRKMTSDLSRVNKSTAITAMTVTRVIQASNPNPNIIMDDLLYIVLLLYS